MLCILRMCQVNINRILWDQTVCIEDEASCITWTFVCGVQSFHHGVVIWGTTTTLYKFDLYACVYAFAVMRIIRTSYLDDSAPIGIDNINL